MRLEKKAFCKPLKDRQAHRPANKRTKRKALGEVSSNVTKKQKRRVSEVLWWCSACQVPCCRRDPNCWKELHMLPGGEQVEEAEEAPQADNTAKRHGLGMNALRPISSSIFILRSCTILVYPPSP